MTGALERWLRRRPVRIVATYVGPSFIGWDAAQNAMALAAALRLWRALWPHNQRDAITVFPFDRDDEMWIRFEPEGCEWRSLIIQSWRSYPPEAFEFPRERLIG